MLEIGGEKASTQLDEARRSNRARFSLVMVVFVTSQIGYENNFYLLTINNHSIRG